MLGSSTISGSLHTHFSLPFRRLLLYVPSQPQERATLLQKSPFVISARLHVSPCASQNEAQSSGSPCEGYLPHAAPPSSGHKASVDSCKP
jgi:hypothetical protein